MVNTGALPAIANYTTDFLIICHCILALQQATALGFIIDAQGVSLITNFNGAHVHTTSVLAAISLSAL